MNKDIKKKWIEALRSGEYKQAQHQLRDGDCFCCLGVLCDIHSRETGVEWDNGFYERNQTHLPLLVIIWAGLGSENVYLSDNSCLTDYNDGSMFVDTKNFAEIADIIEAQL